ncbi:hypothetical protein [Halothermothrix orenii]|nr:hypothetical protein [Halothermothrix orenii]
MNAQHFRKKTPLSLRTDNIYFFMGLLAVFCVLFCLSASVYASNIIEGYIKEVNLQNNTIQINSETYQIKDEVNIYYNGHKSSLTACLPPGQERYQWGVLTLDDKGLPGELRVYYNVIEGFVTEVDYENKKLYLKKFNQDRSDIDMPEFFNWREGITSGIGKLKILKPGDYIVLIVGRGLILEIHKDL